MVSGAELAVIGTLSGAIISGGIGLARTRIQQSAETQRRYGEKFLNKKAEALISFHDALTICENKVDRFKLRQQDGPMADFVGVEEEEVKETIVELFDESDKIYIFLSDDQNETIDEALTGILSIYVSYSNSDYQEYESESAIPEEEARDRVSEAKELLKKELDQPTDFGN